MYNNGKSVADIAQHLSVKQGAVLNQLYKYYEEGNRFVSDHIVEESGLSEEERSAVEASFGKHGTKALKPIFEELETKVTYDELHIMRLYLLAMK